MAEMLPTSRHPSLPGATPATRDAVHTDCRGDTLDSRKLLAGHRAVAIEHEGSRYMLRATRSGKLILTK